MKVNYQSDQPLTNDSCKAATGKTMDEWYAILDDFDAIKKGRRDSTVFLRDDQKVDLWWCTTLAVEYEAARRLKEKDGRLKGYFICSTKTISAPVEKVYSAWTDAGLLSKWFGDSTKVNLIEGGTFENADGNRGEYKRIREHKDLRFIWKGEQDESIVDMILQDKGGGKTGLLINHDRLQSRAEADGVRAAWADALTKLKSLVES
ncbi:MAG: SRPBCC domain-containing protein [Chlorobia bacterium]|nr:SRPBCC domain-containing protein [Fimbriimonadaceae bacterium]